MSRSGERVRPDLPLAETSAVPTAVGGGAAEMGKDWPRPAGVMRPPLAALLVAADAERLSVLPDSVDRAAIQLIMWPGPEQLHLPDQLALPDSMQPLDDRVPAGAKPVQPPDAPAAIECVARVLAETCAVLGVSVPRVRWFRAIAGVRP